MSRQTAYDLLDVPRGLPGWKHTKKVQNALSEVLDAYECSADELPKVLQLALRTLSNADIRDQYDSFLEWSEDGDAVAFKNLDEMRQKAQAMFFRLDDVGGGKVRVVHLGLPDPEPPGMSPDLHEKASGPVQAQREPAGEPAQKLKWNFLVTPENERRYGVENGHPPLILGTNAYKLHWHYMARLDRVLRLSDGARQFTFTVTEKNGSVEPYTFNDWMPPNLYPDDDYNTGGHYTLFFLVNTLTSDSHWASFIGWHDRFPIYCASGLISHFPFYSFWPSDKFVSSADSYLRDYPSRYIGEQFFINTDWRKPWPKELSKMLLQCIEYVAFWTVATAWELTEDPAQIRAGARQVAQRIPQVCFGLPRKIRKSIGLPYDMKD